MMNEMTAKIGYADDSGYVMDLGTIKSISLSFSISTSSSSILLWGYKGTFCMDMGVTLSVTITYERVSPPNPNTGSDSTKWSNALWKQRMKDTFGVWQAKHEGCKLDIISNDTTLFPSFGYYGFVSSFTSPHSSREVNSISGSVKFDLGRIKLTSTPASHARTMSVPSTGRRAYLAYGDMVVALGIINDIQDTLSVTNNANQCKTAMVKVEQQFAMDTGAKESIRISMNHINGDDSCTNAQWVYNMIALVNRWQAETDGCRFVYIPENDIRDYVQSYDENAYVSSLNITYNAGLPEVVASTMQLEVGSIQGGNTSAGTGSPLTKMYVGLNYDSRAYTLCGIQTDGTFKNYIERMRITGGINQPFESLTLDIPRAMLIDILGLDPSEGSTDADISSGIDTLTLQNAMGNGDFIIRGISTDKANYTITAYSVAQAFMQTYTSTPYGAKVITKEITTGTVEIPDTEPAEDDEPTRASDTSSYPVDLETEYEYTPVRGEYTGPLDILKAILSEGVRIGDELYTFDDDNPVGQGKIHYIMDSPSDLEDENREWDFDYEIIGEPEHPYDTSRCAYFPKNTNSWYVIQLCTMALNSRIIFAGGDCYIYHYVYQDNIDLSESGSLYKYLVDIPKIGDCSIDSVINKVVLKHGNLAEEDIPEEVYRTETWDRDSTRIYGERTATRHIMGVLGKLQAMHIGDVLIYRHGWTAQSLTFTLSENHKGTWEPTYILYYPEGIYDEINNISLWFSPAGLGESNELTGLVKYTRNFPECTSTYTFGPPDLTSLPKSISKLDSSVDN